MALRGGIGDHSAFGFSYTQGSGSEDTNVRIEQDTTAGSYDSNTSASPNQTTQNAGTEEFDIYGQDSDPTTRTQSTPAVNNPTVSTTGGDNGVPENNTNPGSPTAPDSPPSTTNPASQQAPQNSPDGSGPATPAGQNSNPASPQQPQQPQFSGGNNGGASTQTPVNGGGTGNISMGDAGGASQATTNAIGNGASDLGDTPATDAVTEGQEIYYEIEDPITHEIRRVNQEEYDVWVAQVNEEKRNALKEMGFNDYDINRIIYQGVDAQALYQRILDRTETDPNATSDEALYEAMYFMSLRGEIPKIPGVELTLEDFDYTSFAGFDEHVAEVVAFANMLSEQAFLRDIDENTAIYLLIEHMAGGFENLDDAYKNTIIAFRTVDEYGIVQYWYNPGGPPPIPQGMEWEYVRFNEFYGDSEMYKELEELIPWREEEVSDAGFWFWTWWDTKIATVRTINFSDPAVLAFYERVQQQYQDHYIIWWEKPEEVVAAVGRAQALSAISEEIHHNLEYNMENIFAYIKQPDWAEYCKFDYVQVRIVENAESRVIYDGYGMGYLYITTDEERAAFLACVFAGKAKISGSYVYTDHGCYQVSDGDVFNHYMQKWATETDQNGNPIISDTEKAIFMYILNKQGAEAAIDYIEGIADEVDTRYYRAETGKARAWAQANWFNGVLASIASVIITPFEGIGAFFNSVGAIGTDHIWRSDVISYGNVYRSAVSEAIRYKHNADGSIMVDETGAYVANHPTLAFIYDTGMSIADTAAMIVVGYFTGGSGFLAELAISTAMMGSRVYVSSLNDALDRGVSPRMAVIYAIGTSAIESLMEAYSLGHLVNLEAKLGATSINLIRRIGEKTGSQFITANAYILACMVSQAICEADEELCTEILDTIWDNVVCQDLSSFNLTMAGYMQAGESHEQAFLHALKDKRNDCFQAWLGGLASGLVFGAFKGRRVVKQANGSMNDLFRTTGASVGGSQTQLNLQDASQSTAAQLGRNSMESGAIDYSQAQPGVQVPSSLEATTQQLINNNSTNVAGILANFNIDAQTKAQLYADILALYDSANETIVSPVMVNTMINNGLQRIQTTFNPLVLDGTSAVELVETALGEVQITIDVLVKVSEILDDNKFQLTPAVIAALQTDAYNAVVGLNEMDETTVDTLAQEFANKILESQTQRKFTLKDTFSRIKEMFKNGFTKFSDFKQLFKTPGASLSAIFTPIIDLFRTGTKVTTGTVISRLNEGSITLTDLTGAQIDTLLNINDPRITPAFRQTLKTISDQNVTALEKSILSKIRPNMSQMEVARLIYYELGKQVDYSEAFKYAGKYDVLDLHGEIYNNTMTFEQIENNNSIICVHWSQLYSKILRDAGFNPSSIVIQRVVPSEIALSASEPAVKIEGNFVFGSHSGIYIMLDDGTIIMPDLTAPIGKMDDTYNVKFGRETQGFIVFTPEQVAALSGIDTTNETLTNLLQQISQFDEAMGKVYTIQNNNFEEKLNTTLTPEQIAFFTNVGKFLFAAESGGNVELSALTDARTKLESQLFNYLRTTNAGILAAADSTIMQYIKDISSMINGLFIENEVVLESTRLMYESEILSGELTENFININNVRNTNMITLFKYLQEMLKLYNFTFQTEADLKFNVKKGKITQEQATAIMQEQSTRAGIRISPLQFTEQHAMITVDLFDHGKPIGPRYVYTVIDGKVTFVKITESYNQILKILGDKKIDIRLRRDLQSIAPNANSFEITSKLNDIIESMPEFTEKLSPIIQTAKKEKIRIIIDDIFFNNGGDTQSSLKRLNDILQMNAIDPKVSGFANVEEYRAMIIDELISSGDINKLAPVYISTLIQNRAIVQKLVGTEALNNTVASFIGNDVNFPLNMGEAFSYLSNDDFNKIFDSPVVQEKINGLNKQSLTNLLSTLKSGNCSFQIEQNDTIINKICSLNINDALEVINDVLLIFDLSQESNKFMNAIVRHFFTKENIFEDFNATFNLAYTVTDYFNLADIDLRNYRNNVEAEFFDGFISTLNQISEFKIERLRYVADSNSVYDFTIEVDGKRFTIAYTTGSNFVGKGYIDIIKFFQQNFILGKALDGKVKIINIEKNVIKSNMIIGDNEGVQRGINVVYAKVDGVLKKFIVSSYGTEINMLNLFNELKLCQSFEVLKVKPLGILHVENLNPNSVYLITIKMEDGTTREFYRHPKVDYAGNGSINLSDVVISENLTDMVNYSIRELTRDEVNKASSYSIRNMKAFADIFSPGQYGGNQSDVSILLRKLLEKTSDKPHFNSITLAKAELFNTMIDKYFPNATNAEKMSLAEHYAKGGCCYMAFANAFVTYMASIENGAEIFKQKMGFDIKFDGMFFDEVGKVGYNFEAVAFDMYLSYISKVFASRGFATIGELVKAEDVIVGFKGEADQREKAIKYFESKGIQVDYTSMDDLNSTAGLLAAIINQKDSFIILASTRFDMELLSPETPGTTPKDAALLSSVVEGNIEKNIGGHGMLVTDVQDGELIVSSWSKKYRYIHDSIKGRTGSDSGIWAVRFGVNPQSSGAVVAQTDAVKTIMDPSLASTTVGKEVSAKGGLLDGLFKGKKQKEIEAVAANLRNVVASLDYKAQTAPQNHAPGLIALRDYINFGNPTVISSYNNCRAYVTSVDKQILIEAYNLVYNETVENVRNVIKIQDAKAMANPDYMLGIEAIKAYLSNGYDRYITRDNNCRAYITSLNVKVLNEIILTIQRDGGTQQVTPTVQQNVNTNVQNQAASRVRYSFTRRNNVTEVNTAAQNQINQYSVLAKIEYALNNGVGKIYDRLVSLTGTQRRPPTQNMIDKFYAKFNSGNGYWVDSSNPYWSHVMTNDFNTRDVQKRIYINLDNFNDVIDFTMRFADKCRQRGIPFYFKTSNMTGGPSSIMPMNLTRDESLVIYSGNEYLAEYTNICNEIRAETNMSFKAPPVLTGVLDGFMGYGSEPNRGRRESYNSLRSNLLAEAINRTNQEFMRRYQNTDINAILNSIRKNSQEYQNYLNSLYTNIINLSSSYGIDPNNFFLNTGGS